MGNFGKYCCFFCPSKDYTERSIDTACEKCGREYGFVLKNHPLEIRDFKITKSLGRGFYGAAFIAERGVFGRKSVVKITPASFYPFFKKPEFVSEVKLHAKVAENAFHVVGISDAFEEEVRFSDKAQTRLPCYVTVLDFVDGPLLKDLIIGDAPVPVASVCQIAIDLLRLRVEFESAELHHNDLHAENLIVQGLRPGSRGNDAIDSSLKVVAIDLGSVADGSKSDDIRKGDLAFIATHVDTLLRRLLAKPESLDDRDFRVGLALQGIINGLQADAQNVRVPNPDDLIEQIREAYYRASHPWYPWRSPLRLKSFSDHYNAQTLDSWHVPALLVDPGNRWLAEVTRPGPQIITGMRGCGKTMLLRALDVHARAAQSQKETATQILERVRSDRFVGLFASAQRLLDLKEQALLKIEHRLTRLFVAYALQAARALIHLKDVDPGSVAPHAHARLASAIADYLQGGEQLREAVTLEDLERGLLKLLVLTVSGDGKFLVRQSPAEVFSHLADQFRRCSEVLQASTVLYLLDDVSTRYLDLEKVESLLSALLFQSPICAFKFTSEWQTIELGLRSPGRIHPIRVDRDLTVFDLGADVFEKINSPGSLGKEFVAQILRQRAEILASHPVQRDPKEILGDVSLEQVAREIASSNQTSGQKKRIYRGLSCLTNVCVGDLGDIIKLYENILRRAGHTPTFPIPAETQSRCFQDLSSLRLFDLSRRADYFKNHARAYAEVAHELLVRSFQVPRENPNKPRRLRQYSSIYVRITVSDEKAKSDQIDQLRQLIDSGVFVFSGGAPRLKTKDSNPMQQFILSYRKIYGLAAYIGLADRDRFELSGNDLSEWLSNPSSAKEILLRNQIRDEVNAAEPIIEIDSEDAGKAFGDSAAESDVTLEGQSTDMAQGDLFGVLSGAPDVTPRSSYAATRTTAQVRPIDYSELPEMGVSTLLTGLGFEDRTLASNELLCRLVKPQKVEAIRYAVPGHARAILGLWSKQATEVVEHDYIQSVAESANYEGLSLVDISGLAKPLIFKSIRNELATKGRVLVCHASALQHYPLEEDLTRLFAPQKLDDPREFLESLDQVLRGEKGPYLAVRLLNDESDPSRARALLAFASAKHERLFSLMDRREFDQIDVIAPTGDTPRARVATLAAEFICQNHPNARVKRVDSSDLTGLIHYLDAEYLQIYDKAGANLELGLTGSKIQAVASAVLSCVRRVSQAWYLSPREFDERRFSKGVGPIRIFEIQTRGEMLESK